MTVFALTAADGLRVDVGGRDDVGRVAVTATGLASPGAADLEAAAARLCSARADLVTACRRGMTFEIGRLNDARKTVADAHAEHHAAVAGLAAAKSDHKAAVAAARNPAATREAIERAETRVADSAAWMTSAKNLLFEADSAARDAAHRAWRGEVAARAAGAHAANAAAVERVRALLAEVVTAALGAYENSALTPLPPAVDELLGNESPL